MKTINLYTDGSCLGNPGDGGWCAILEYKGTEKTLSGFQADTTNNRMEIMAVIQGLEALKEPCVVELYSDSQYVLNALDSWLANWVKKDFKKVKNVDLWKRMLEVSKPHTLKTHWVKGHNGHAYNEKCDKIARQEALEKGRR